MSQRDPCTAGDIRVIGLTNENVIAGRMELCYSNEWRAVCAGGWDLNDAEVVCQQMLAQASQSGIYNQNKIHCIYMLKFCTNLQQKFWFKCAQTRVLAKAF